MRVADAEVVEERIGGQHALRRREEKGGVDEADDDGDLKKVEKDLELHAGAAVVAGEEEHHEDGGAVEAVEEAPGRIGQEGLAEQGVESMEGGGDEQDQLDGGEEKPKQGGNALGAPECMPGASQCEQAQQNENGFGKTAAGPSGSEQEQTERLGGDQDGEEKTHQPGLAQLRQLAHTCGASSLNLYGS